MDIVDENSTVTDCHVEGAVKYVTVEKKRMVQYCPICGARLISKGKFTRHPKHQVLQDGYVLDLKVIGRRWKCSSRECTYSCYDEFNFVEPHKQITKLIQIQILRKMKDIHLSCVQIGNMFNVSDTYVHQIFMQYVDLKRKPLTECISIDEVYLNISPKCKYALVIMDFETGDILDILESRRKYCTERYFLSIPKEERDKVKYLICDMYDPYVNYTASYFTNACPVTDSFHVLQWLLNLISRYIRTVLQRYKEKDQKALSEKNARTNRSHKTIKESKEVYILKKGQWVMLQNRKNWKYHASYYDHTLGRLMDTYSWEEVFLDLDDNFRTIRSLKDLYEDFNDSYVNDLDGAEKRLNELIEIYASSDIKIFQEFAGLLKRYKTSIRNSFTYVKNENLERNEGALRRLSNGPMESFNNIPSHLRSQSHGIENFEFNRNRILWAVRDDAPITLTPRSKEKVHTKGKKRGPYKRKN